LRPGYPIGRIYEPFSRTRTSGCKKDGNLCRSNGLHILLKSRPY
jgi:hypothetical protein